MAIYKLVRNEALQTVNQVKKIISDDTYTLIPFSQDNTDYQEYLEWTKASPMNVAEEAE